LMDKSNYPRNTLGDNGLQDPGSSHRKDNTHQTLKAVLGTPCRPAEPWRCFVTMT
jgi:hypothetical protein